MTTSSLYSFCTLRLIFRTSTTIPRSMPKIGDVVARLQERSSHAAFRPEGPAYSRPPEFEVLVDQPCQHFADMERGSSRLMSAH